MCTNGYLKYWGGITNINLFKCAIKFILFYLRTKTQPKIQNSLFKQTKMILQIHKLTLHYY